MCWVLTNFLVLEFFVLCLAAAPIGLITGFCKPPNKASVSFCPAAFYLYTNGKVLYL